MSKFVKAISLATQPHGALLAQPGQWFIRPDGTKTQFVGARGKVLTDMVPHFSDAGQGDGFKGRTQRFARARWHLAKRHDGVEKLVKTAPSSVDDARLGAFARKAVGA